MMYRTEEKALLAIGLIMCLAFVGMAVWQFVEGNHTNGILWLILGQLYDNKHK